MFTGREGSLGRYCCVHKSGDGGSGSGSSGNGDGGSTGSNIEDNSDNGEYVNEDRSHLG